LAADFSAAFLDRMHMTGDPPADKVIAEFSRTSGAGAINALLEKLKARERACGAAPGEPGPEPVDIPPVLEEYLEQSSRLPDWADPGKIRMAQDYFTLHGPLFGVALLYKSLPILYACGRGGAQVLAMTGRLTNHYRQRASETLRFILDVMKPGGLSPEGRGIATAQKVRLMHAAIRHYASSSPPFKANPHWGCPINQEELAGTLLAFSSVALDGLASLGKTAPREETEAYLHAWHVVGHILGIDRRLMARDMPEARRAWLAIIDRNFRRSEEGLLLIKDHLEFLDGLIPGEFLDRGNGALLRYLIGRRIAVGCFDMPSPGRLEAFRHLLRGFFGLEKLGYLLFPGLAREARRMSIGLMEALQRYWSDGHSRPFQVPSALREG
jgi:hypothetical protein